MRRGVEIRLLPGDPGEELGYFLVGAKDARISADPFQLRVGKADVKGAVADGVDGPLLPPATALRHRMMPLDPPPKRTGA